MPASHSESLDRLGSYGHHRSTMSVDSSEPTLEESVLNFHCPYCGEEIVAQWDYQDGEQVATEIECAGYRSVGCGQTLTVVPHSPGNYSIRTFDN